jgi:RNA polymerase sigma factor (TIGR02999 family)
MPAPRTEDVTALLAAWQQGDQAALPRLIPLLYEELRRVARARLRSEPPGHVLQTTALVHEAYLRLLNVQRLNVRDRTHLLSLAARLMRQVLVDDARKRLARKRGANPTMVSLSDIAAPAAAAGVDLLALDQALGELASVDPRLSRLVELKFFAGFTIAEAAEALGVSTATIERDWTVARAWLYDRLSRS